MRDRRVVGRMSLVIWLVTLALLAVSRIAAMDIYAEERKVHRAEVPVEVSVEQVPEEFANEQRKLEALEKLKEALGILADAEDKDYDETPPQFMMELYNAVTDNEGYTTSKNPFDAKIVRSLVEKGGLEKSSKLYLFGLSSFKANESVLEAELHLYRKRSLSALMHPAVLSSPYYVIRVYQVLPDKSLDEPDLHRLLNVHYVGAYSSGWQVFNVKQAVLSWLSEESPNLGLLVSATTIFGHQAEIEFVRRKEEHSGKQPILVLFNDDLTSSARRPTIDDDDEAKKGEIDEETDAKRRNKRHGQIEVPEFVERDDWPARYHREKKHRSNERHRKNHGFVPKQRSLEHVLTSMDVYERAMLREKLTGHKAANLMAAAAAAAAAEKSKKAKPSSRAKREIDELSKEQALELEKGAGDVECRKAESETCAKRELYVNFRDIGMPSIIAPEGYAAYQCRGHCKSPLSQDQKPTNHATIQSIIHKMNLAPDEDVREPCCVPVSLSSISILYHNDDLNGIVLKSYAEMAVVSCGCR